ncbi:MAG: 2,4-dihydroxyhept-2-ene-1,7-dioic acid aldolase [Acidimicrobiia bacterium]|nr:2,4-dihydroxyhept-2-ene-1,7-dioic acid aldolase [Acidimicrobiia bacterium]
MRTNWVREKLRAGTPTVGCFMGLGSPNVAELMSHAGFDWLVVETEHSALDSSQVEHMLMALKGTEVIPLVRLPSGDPVFIQRALDIGAMGIVAPLVRTAEEARAIVAATRYPPAGTRGFGPLRAAHYMFDSKDYFYRANENLLVVLIVETREAAENLEAIAAVPGVDALFLGPFDLCLSLGLDPMKQPHAEVEAVTQRMLAASQKTNVAIGIHAMTPEQMEKRQQQGFRMISYSTDYMLLADAVRAGLSAFKRDAPAVEGYK